MTKFISKPYFQGLLIAVLFATGLALPCLSFAQSAGSEAGEGIFEVLASEIALQYGEVGLAYNTYMEMARRYKDPRLAERAMEIAIAAGSADLALQATQSWSELSSPSDIKPKEVQITLLALSQRWPEVVKPAIALLRQESPPQRDNTLLQLQSLLSKANNETEAMLAFYEIVSSVKPEPKDPSVLYTYAMSAEKAGHVDVMENILRQILRNHPNDVNTLNALGYSLADRNLKLTEAFTLITKANQLSPRDAFILDSLGWVNFRLGNNAIALEKLQQAFRQKPEADIAAHLGEVLWVMNRPSEAEDIWHQGQKLNANDVTLKETLKRLKPAWTLTEQAPKGLWDGRFAVKITGLTESQNQGGSGGFTLSQDALKDILEIRNPIGGAIAKITISPGEASLERNGEVITAVDADNLIRNALGLPLPARGLSNWLRGEVRPGGVASIERDEKGRAAKIVQDGWTLNYTWSDSNHLEKLLMARSSNIGSIDIRLVFDNPND
jgi:outer membrane biogenesis lipoprotein LolB/Flp pilus assembly protein TadD